MLVGLDFADLFGHAAADTFGSMVQTPQLAAASALAALLGEALRFPEAFATRIGRYALGAEFIPVVPGFGAADVDDDDHEAVEDCHRRDSARTRCSME